MNDYKELKRTFYRLETFQFPIKRRYNYSYLKTIEDSFKLFESKIEQLNNKGELSNFLFSNLELIKETNESLINCIKLHYKGNSGKAYNQFENILNNPNYKNCLHYLTDEILPNENLNLFRLRISENKLSKREDIFHIPFSKRNLVAKQRYSIDGLPCLYLGSSIFNSWLEINNTDFSKLWISKFKLKRKKKILNLAYDLKILFDKFDNKEIDIEKFKYSLLFYPIIFICSFRTQDPNSSFFEEYIVSNFILQWLSFKKNISGLKYISSKMDFFEYYHLGLNYVFPPTDIDIEEDYCSSLIQDFELTNPMAWNLLNFYPSKDYACTGNDSSDTIESIILKNYNVTQFGMIEQQLNDMTISSLPLPKHMEGKIEGKSINKGSISK